MSPVQPNFFLVGAPKAGTTSLYHYLRQHPQIYMSPIKEPNYFASEISIENVCEGMRDHARRERGSASRIFERPHVRTAFRRDDIGMARLREAVSTRARGTGGWGGQRLLPVVAGGCR